MLILLDRKQQILSKYQHFTLIDPNEKQIKDFETIKSNEEENEELFNIEDIDPELQVNKRLIGMF